MSAAGKTTNRDIDSAMKQNGIAIVRSSGNVFQDVGFSREESAHLAIRAELLIQLQKLIASRGLMQAQVQIASGHAAASQRSVARTHRSVQHRFPDRHAGEIRYRCTARSEATPLSQRRLATRNNRFQADATVGDSNPFHDQPGRTQRCPRRSIDHHCTTRAE